MASTPFRILFYDDENQYGGWDFDKTEFESAEAAFDYAQIEYAKHSFRVVKLLYPKED